MLEMPVLLVSGIFILGSSFYVISIYNRLISLREGVKQAFANIDVLLAQRNNEIPKLIEVAKKYMEYEKKAFEDLIRARVHSEQYRKDGDIERLGQSETQMVKGIAGLVALAEAYPELKADQSFSRLIQRISELEDSISDRREVFNEAATINNVRIQEVPDFIVAGIFGFKHTALLTFEKEALNDVNVKSLFEK